VRCREYGIFDRCSPILLLLKTQNPRLKTQNSPPLNPVEIFIANFETSLANKSFRKLTLGKFRGDLGGVEHIYVRGVTLKDGIRLSFVHRFPDHDLTQNHPVQHGVAMVRDWLGKASLAATLFTSDRRQQLLFNRHGKPRLTSTPVEPVEVREQHDREKPRLLKDETFLKYLGVLDPAGNPKAQMRDKYRQIHHFVALMAPPLRKLDTNRQVRVVDMGSGKGYLTFAIYAFLQQEGFNVEVAGVERRRALVDLCNSVATRCEFDHLRFELGEISTAGLDSADIVIALHACDIATDDAIYRAIAGGAQLIFVAPCCHKELRPQLAAPEALAPLFMHGIQIDRMAEAITDALRCMYLEASGYLTRIQEFIALEHTPKNLLIIAAKNPKAVDRDLLFRRASAFQEQFGISHQRLGDLLAEDSFWRDQATDLGHTYDPKQKH
jgi:SAM-dependent methyltransferase